MGKTIRIECEGADTIDHKKLLEFQGELKSLTNDDYMALRGRIEKKGFRAPIFVWKDKGKNNILDGHQRLRVVKSMVEEGWECPPLPVIYVKAKNIKDAKEEVLALITQYGRAERQGMYEFVTENKIPVDMLLTDFRIPDFDLHSWRAEFFDPIPGLPASDGGSKKLPGELGENMADDVKHVECPKCGERFPI